MDFSIIALLGVAEGASTWSNIGAILLRVLIVLLGVNMLVIVHEWGHFIVARMCGVRCDKFYIWFDAYGFKLFSFKRGNTEYGLGWLPLGGYVKMFGQEDNPGGIQAEIDRAKAERNENESVLTDDEKKVKDEEIAVLEKQLYAPDSYLSKNVFQRMAIISAGVFMNIVFAIVCATCAALMGTPETSAKIGYVAPGSPAWEAGLQEGDQIVGINDDKEPIFSSILVACMDAKEINFEVLKAGSEESVVVPITPRSDKGALTPMIGVGPAPSLDLAETNDRRPYRLSLNSVESEKISENLDALIGGERLVSMNGRPINSTLDYIRYSRLYIDQPIEYVFAPTYSKRGGERFIDESKERVAVTIDPIRESYIGVRLSMGEIIKIQSGSVAEKCGLRARKLNEAGEIVQHGDIILDINNEPVVNPLAFPYQIFNLTSRESFEIKVDEEEKNVASREDERVHQSRTIVLTVDREGKREDIPITLPNFAAYSGSASSHGELACGALGISYEVLPIVSGTDGTVIFESKHNPIGGKIVALEALIPNPGKVASSDIKSLFKTLTGKKVSESEIGTLVSAKTDFLKKDDSSLDATGVLDWFTSVLPVLPEGTDISVTVETLDGNSMVINTKVQRYDDIYSVGRGLYFGVDAVFQRTNRIGEALVFGWNKTLESATQVFVFLKNVGKNVSAKALGGPGTIVGTAYAAAGRNDGVFLLFLCLISANLAVVNFLPIPVLDGGHMVFLLYEMIVRRKPNESFQIALSWVGFVLILALMFWTICLDVLRYCF